MSVLIEDGNGEEYNLLAVDTSEYDFNAEETQESESKSEFNSTLTADVREKISKKLVEKKSPEQIRKEMAVKSKYIKKNKNETCPPQTRFVIFGSRFVSLTVSLNGS